MDRVPDEFERAAESGAVLALTQASQPFTVTVTMIRFAPADTTADGGQWPDRGIYCA